MGPPGDNCGHSGYHFRDLTAGQSLFARSQKVQDLERRLAGFMGEYVYPNEAVFRRQVAQGDRWQPTPIVEELKARARAAGLWNLFLPESGHAAGLTNTADAPQ